MTSRSKPEFSVIINVPQLHDGDNIFELEADSQTRAALAQRFDLLGIEALSATVRVRRHRDGRVIRLRGRLAARVTQQCVVTLAPVESRVDEPIRIDFYTEYQSDTEDIPNDDHEPLEGDEIDLGEIVAEEFALALDPYPRAPNAELDYGSADSRSVQDDRNHPFAGLAGFKARK